MNFPLSFWDISLLLAVTAIILLITSELASPYYGKTNLIINKKRLRNIIKGLELVAKEFHVPMIYPIHLRTRKRITQFNIASTNTRIKFVEPVDYLDFLKLLRNAKLVFTDSGGVQEEACILKVPCVTLRYNTERPETLEVGSNILAGAEPKSILEKANLMINKSRDWKNPFGDGKAAKRIVNIIQKKTRNP